MPDPQSFLPLSHLSYHILLALRDGPLHGYAVVKAVDRSSGGVISPGTGTFYSAIHRLVREGLIDQATEGGNSDNSDQRRKYYSVTPVGREVLRLETGRLEALLARARAAGRAGS